MEPDHSNVDPRGKVWSGHKTSIDLILRDYAQFFGGEYDY
jgi:hypothetical protein